MADNQERIEIERVVNLLNSFGWEKQKEEILTDHILITIRKEREIKETPEMGPM